METKATPKYFDGIKYVPMSDIPMEQVQLFSGWVSIDSFINQAESSKIGNSDLIRYEDYEYWFDNHYLAEKDWDQLI